MQRFILRYRGPGSAPEADVLRIRTSPLQIIDESPRMVLVEGEGLALSKLLSQLDRWVSSVDHDVALPDPRLRPSRS
jgi:hypothetical protein